MGISLLFLSHVYDNLLFIVIKPLVKSYQINSWVTFGGRLHCPVTQEIWIPLATPPPPQEDVQPGLISHRLKDLLLLFAVGGDVICLSKDLDTLAYFGSLYMQLLSAWEPCVPVYSSSFNLERRDNQSCADLQPAVEYCSLPADPVGNSEMLAVLSH